MGCFDTDACDSRQPFHLKLCRDNRYWYSILCVHDPIKIGKLEIKCICFQLVKVFILPELHAICKHICFQFSYFRFWQ